MTTQIRPDLTLSMDEKIYLAVSKNTDNKIAFVYTLACLQMANKPGTYNLIPTRESHAFKDKDAAQIFYTAVKQIIGFNEADKNKAMLFSANEDLIKNFKQNVK